MIDIAALDDCSGHAGGYEGSSNKRAFRRLLTKNFLIFIASMQNGKEIRVKEDERDVCRQPAFVQRACTATIAKTSKIV